MKPNVPLEFASLAAVDSEGNADVPDPVSKLFQDAELAAQLKMSPRAAAQHVHNFQIEIADINARVSSHYAKIASDAAKAEKRNSPAGGDSRALAKRANDGDTHKVARVEETKIGSSIVIAEFDRNGVCVRTYAKEAA